MDPSDRIDTERMEEDEAAREAREVGGRVPEHEGADPSQRAIEEGGEGVSEGFELAEEDLIEHASHGDEQSARPAYHLRGADEERELEDGGEADRFLSSETEEGDR